MNILIQCIISYIGLLPYIYCLIDIYFLEYLSPIILLNIMLYNTLLIFTFIGAINWDFGKGTIFLTIYGFIPSLISFGIIIFSILGFDQLILFTYLILFLLIQLCIDYLIYLRKKANSFIIYYLRIPVTFSLCLFLLIPLVITPN